MPERLRFRGAATVGMSAGVGLSQIAGAAAIAAGILALGSGALLAAATRGDPRALAGFGYMIDAGPGRAQLLRWGLILDMFGYYLLLAPLAIYLHRWLPGAHGVGLRLVTFSGLAYMLVGAAGAAALAAAAPPLMATYASAAATLATAPAGGAPAAAALAQREAAAIVFTTLSDVVYHGLWNPLEALLIGTWWLGIGPALRGWFPAAGLLAIAGGACAILDAAGLIAGLLPLHILGLLGLLAAVPCWAVVIGVALLRSEPL